MYMYAWYEMLGLIMLGGTAVYALVRGMDLLLETWLDRRHAKRDRALREMADASERASEGLISWAKRNQPRG